jgi:hypothetical protein
MQSSMKCIVPHAFGDHIPVVVSHGVDGNEIRPITGMPTFHMEKICMDSH